MLSWNMLWAILPLVLGFIFRQGHLLFLIAGNNTARKPYTKESLLAGKYVGLIAYITAVFVILIVIPMPDVYIYILTGLFLIITLAITVRLNQRISKMQK